MSVARFGWLVVWVGSACAVAGGQAGLSIKALPSPTAASLRGVDALSEQVAWFSGSAGTVLLTTDGGASFKTCAVPQGAEKLDFRGVQGFDAQTAVVMASGKGSLSAIYRTSDGCATWKMVFADPDEGGFFDALKKVTARQMYLMGDPVDGKFTMFFSPDQGETWLIADDPGREAVKDAGAFAASNSSFVASGNLLLFGTGATATDAAKVYRTRAKCPAVAPGKEVACAIEWVSANVPVAAGSQTAGVFSLGARNASNMRGEMKTFVLAVGGDYGKPESPVGTAAYSGDGGEHWTVSPAGPAGYRSGLAINRETSRWIAVGPTGSDTSVDDGKSWKPLAGDTSGWNAISLPFVVGAKGKIGILK